MHRYTEREKRCKRHPKHMQSKGVCPSCLREKLNHLSSSSSSSTTATYSSTSSSCSSPYSSDESDLSSYAPSPPHTTMLALRPKTKAGGMAKSQSFGFIAKDRKEGGENKEDKERKKNKNKGSFLSKLMTGSGRRKEEDGALSHSKTMKEKSSSKWALFA